MLDLIIITNIISSMEQLEHNQVIIGKDISLPLAATAILQQHGFNLTETGKAFGITKQAVIARNKNLPASLNLVSKKRVRMAIHAVDSFMQGKTIGEVDKIKDSTVLAASQMVLDRHQPIKRDESTAHVSYTNINVTVFKT